MGDGFTMLDMRYRGNVAALAFALGMAFGCGSDPEGFITGSNTTAGDEFGWGLALSSDGQTLAVGAPGEASNATGIDGDQSDNSVDGAGAVYLFSRKGDLWPQQAYVKASNPGPLNSFGASVALSSDGATLVVGAAAESSNAIGINGDQTNNSFLFAGAVYVFVRAGNSWSQEAYIKASNTRDRLGFGGAVALSADGSSIAAGAVGDSSSATGINGDQTDTSASDAGAVYVFTRVGSTWSQQAYVKRSGTRAGQHFGSAVALSSDGSTLAVASDDASRATGINGDPTDDGAYMSGAVFVFARAGDTWSEQAYVKASNTGDNNAFGTSIALSSDGSLLAVGAPFEASSAKGIGGDQTQGVPGDDGWASGAVYVFVRDHGTWSQQTYVKASDSKGGLFFGSAVALASDGSALFATAPYERGGTVYAFTRSGTTWSEETSVWRDRVSGFATSVVSSSDASTVAIGTHDQGAYVYLGGLASPR
jgi:hypothetical protein